MNLPAAVRRLAAHRTVTGAAALTVMLAALTFAILVSAATAVSDMGTRRALAASPSSEAVSFTAARGATEDQATKAIAAESRRLLAPYPVRVTHADVSLPVPVTGPRGAAWMTVAAADSVASHVRIVGGHMPGPDVDENAAARANIGAPAAATDGQPIADLLLPSDLAEFIGAAPGGTVAVGSPFDPTNKPGVYRVSGVYQPADDEGSFWTAVSAGSPASAGNYVSFGPPAALSAGPIAAGGTAAPAVTRV